MPSAITTRFAPMTIDALVADRFVPIVADDATRALGESGLLSMAFTVEADAARLVRQDTDLAAAHAGRRRRRPTTGSRRCAART